MHPPAGAAPEHGCVPLPAGLLQLKGPLRSPCLSSPRHQSVAKHLTYSKRAPLTFSNMKGDVKDVKGVRGRRGFIKVYSFQLPSFLTFNIYLEKGCGCNPIGLRWQNEPSNSVIGWKRAHPGVRFTTALGSWYMRGWEERKREERSLGAAALSNNSNATIPALPVIMMLCAPCRCKGIYLFIFKT